MRNFIKLLVATVGLILLVKSTLPEPQKNEEEIKQFWSTKTHAPSKYDIVACGDSRLYRGLSPDDLTSELNQELSCINLGYSSAGLSNAYLDFAISKFRPESENKILIIGITPHSLTLNAFKNEALNEYLNLSSFEKFRYQYLSDILKHFSSYKPCEIINHRKANYQENYMSNGWVASYYLIPDSTSALKNYRQIFKNQYISGNEVDALVIKLKRIVSKGIKILAFRPPNTEQMRALEDSLSGYNKYNLKQKLIESSVVWLDFKNSDFISYDGSHLDQNSAKILSKRIGEKINELDLAKSKLD